MALCEGSKFAAGRWVPRERFQMQGMNIHASRLVAEHKHNIFAINIYGGQDTAYLALYLGENTPF